MLSANDCLIHVSNLPINATDEFLRSFFQDCGNVVKVTSKHRPNSNFAFVQFDTKEAAIRAVANYNYTKLNGEPIIITYASIEYMRIIHSGLGNIFIRGLDENIEASQLHELFSNFGEVISCKVPTQYNKNKGYAYIQFKNPADAERAKIELSDATINGKPISIETYLKRENPNAMLAAKKAGMNDVFTNVFIKNLPDQIRSLYDLVSLFVDYGPVVSARIIFDKRAGFCNMGDHESAVRALNGLNGRIIGGKTLITCRALTKEERMAFQSKPENNN